MQNRSFSLKGSASTEIKKRFLSRLTDKIDEIIQLTKQLSEKPDEKDPAIRLQDISHSLKKTAKTLHLNEHSSIANSIGLLAENLLIQPKDTYGAIFDNLTSLTNRLIQLSSQQSLIEKSNSLAKTSTPQHCLCILTNDPSLKEALIELVHQSFYQVQFYENLTQIITIAREYHAYGSALIIDLDEFNTLDPTILDTLKTVPQHIITISRNDDFTKRLYAAKLNAKSFLLKPLNTNEFLDNVQFLTLSQSHSQKTQKHNKVMIIHTDFKTSELIEKSLQNFDLNVLSLSSYYECLPKAIEFNPDLVIIYEQLNSITGFEIASILKQHPAFSFLSCAILSEADIDQHIKITEDDGYQFLPIPKNRTSETLFLNKVSNLLYNNHKIKSTLSLDYLTSLLSEDKFLKALHSLISTAKRNQQPFSVITINIDHLSHINETYGYWCGDRVIVALSTLLKKRLRSGDVIGRFENNHIIIAMPNTPIHNAKQAIHNLKELFSSQAHNSSRNSFFASFSAGISDYPKTDNLENLIELSQYRLSIAKTKGRNWIEAGEKSTIQETSEPATPSTLTFNSSTINKTASKPDHTPLTLSKAQLL